MNKPIKISAVAYEMLAELARKAKTKPDQYVDNLIQIKYKGK